MDGMLTMSRLSFRPDALGQTATFTLSCFLSCLGKSVSFGTVCLRCTAPGLRMMHGCQLQSTESLTRLSHCQIARGRDPQHVRQSRPLTDDGSQREPSPTNRSFYPLAALALRPPDIEGRGLRLYGPESIRFPLAAACPGDNVSIVGPTAFLGSTCSQSLHLDLARKSCPCADVLASPGSLH